MEAHYHSLFGSPLGPLSTWQIDHLIPEGRVREFWETLGDSGVHSKLKPYAGAIFGIRLLQRVADVYIVTAPLRSCATWCRDREVWLEDHFGIRSDSVVHTHAKHVFNGSMLIDDNPAHVEQWAAEHPSGVAVLFDRRYNRAHRFSSSVSGRVWRTDDWSFIAGLGEK